MRFSSEKMGPYGRAGGTAWIRLPPLAGHKGMSLSGKENARLEYTEDVCRHFSIEISFRR